MIAVNKDLEEEIIRLFFLKEKQDRILWELSTIKKRKNCLFKICDQGFSMLKTEYIRYIKFMKSDELQNILLKQGAIRPMYYIGEDWADILIENISIKQAIENFLYGDWSPGLLYFGNGIAYYEGLQHIGAPRRCILVHKSNYK